MNSPREPGGR
uniref:Uncharacterized protein n=1 Tax=Lepeophtheirus salmonis TaxID=72036 RepID=A0A0K2VLX1_LEPSM